MKFPRAKLALFMYSFGVAAGRPTMITKQRLIARVSIQASYESGTSHDSHKGKQDRTNDKPKHSPKIEDDVEIL